MPKRIDIYSYSGCDAFESDPICGRKTRFWGVTDYESNIDCVVVHKEVEGSNERIREVRNHVAEGAEREDTEGE